MTNRDKVKPARLSRQESLIYETIRKAKKALSPKEISDKTKGRIMMSAIYGQLGQMVTKKAIARIEVVKPTAKDRTRTRYTINLSTEVMLHPARR